MDFAVRKPPASHRAGWALSSAWPLFGLYVFLAAAIGCVGAAAGQLFFLGYPPLSNSFTSATNRCVLRFPIATDIQALDHCWAGAYRSQGWFVLESAGAMLVLTAGLILVVPWLDRWRLARAPRFADNRAEAMPVTARFRLLCTEAGLAGRRCPDLLVAGVPEAFTTVLPGGRPLVVLPVKVALGCDDPRRFDPVVMHELAHVRMRDVSLASAVRGISWITIPVMVLASLPELLTGGQEQVQGASLTQAALFILAAILVTAALLRFREIAADRQAAVWLGSPRPLSDLLATAGEQAGAGMRASDRWWLRPLARHPSLAARRATLRLPAGPRTAGLAYGFAVGAVTAMTMAVCFSLAESFDQPAAGWLPIRVWAATGGIFLGLGLVPALLRDAERSKRTGKAAVRWDTAAGAGLGLLLGSIVPPGTAASATISVVVGSGFTGVTTAVILALTGAGLTILIAQLASLAAGWFLRPPAWLTAFLAITTCCWAAGALEPVRLLSSTGFGLYPLILTVGGNPWRALLLLYPATVILLTTRIRLARTTAGTSSAPDRRPRPASTAQYRGRRASAILSPAMTAICAAVSAVALLLWRNPLDRSETRVFILRWFEEEWLVCALAGFVVLVILVLAKGSLGLASACIAAWSAALLAVLGTVAYEAITGWPGSLLRLAHNLADTPSVLLFYLALPTSLLALLPAQRLPMPKQRWMLPASAGAGAAAAAALVFVSGVSSSVEPLVPQSAFPSSPCGQLGGVATTSSPSLALDANQVLTNAAARKVIDGVCTGLPAGWARIAPTATTSVQKSVFRPAGCAQLGRERFVDVLGRPLAQAQGDYQITAGAIAGSEALYVVVNSIARPAPASLFAAAYRDLASCHRYVSVQPARTQVWTAHGFNVPENGAQTWGVDFSTSLRIKGRFAGESITWEMASIGRDVIIVIQQTVTLGTEPPPDHAVTAAAMTAVVADFRQSALSAGLACSKFRTATATLGHEIASAGDNGFNSAQRADFRAYGAAITQLGELVGRSGSDAGLVRDLELTGAASAFVGMAPKPSTEEVAALTEDQKLYPLERQACIAIGSWPK